MSFLHELRWVFFFLIFNLVQFQSLVAEIDLLCLNGNRNSQMRHARGLFLKKAKLLGPGKRAPSSSSAVALSSFSGLSIFHIRQCIETKSGQFILIKKSIHKLQSKIENQYYLQFLKWSLLKGSSPCF